MATIQLYDKLLQFQLFQGMGRGELMQVVSKTKFDFIKVSAGKRIVKEGDRCDRMLLLMNGTVRTETTADDNSYTVCEEHTAPYIFAPESLFGLSQRYMSAYYAETDTSIIAIDKHEIATLSDSLTIFRINMLNMLTTQTQRLLNRPWNRCPRTLQERITRFFTARCTRPAGRKVFKIRMTQLAAELNDSRINISIALNGMQADGLIKLNRGTITIPKLEKVIGTMNG